MKISVERQRIKVKDYPEAPGKIQHYDTLISELQTHESEIKSVVSRIKRNNNTNKSNTINADAEGEYYDAYVMQKDKWITSLETTLSIFDMFLADLSVCIQNANSKKSEWLHKDTLYHYEEI